MVRVSGRAPLCHLRSDVRIECHAHYSVSVVASTPMVEGGVTVLAERSGLSGLVLVERADNDLRISLLNCEVAPHAPKPVGCKGRIDQTKMAKLHRILSIVHPSPTR